MIDDVDPALGVTVPPHSKWIGVMARPVNASLRAHLDIPENSGLLIEEVIPDSPAAQAGLEKYDILLSANSEALTNLPDLIRSVVDAGDDAIRLTWMRRGTVMEGQVTPAERPQSNELTWHPQQGDARPMIDGLRAWADSLEGNELNLRGPLKLRVFGEGFGVDDQEFPADLSVKIQKSGNQPARITVRKGNSSWEITEDRIDELPEDVRPFVSNMLHGQGIQGPVQFDLIGPEWRDQMPWPQLDERMQEMNERMERMFEELRELREAQPAEEDTIDA